MSVRQLQNLLEEHDDIPWEALTFLIGEVIYGGRVTDEWDMRCLGALLKRFFCPEALTENYSYSPDQVTIVHITAHLSHGAWSTSLFGFWN